MMKAIGQNALRERLALRVPPPHVQSYATSGMRRTEVQEDRTVELYPRGYDTDGTLASDLRFALRYEPLDLGVLAATFRASDPQEIVEWVLKEPTGQFSRRAWFLYEFLTRKRLELPDATQGNYVPALDAERHIVASRINSPRHRVANNLLGNWKVCPTVRLTPRLIDYINSDVSGAAKRLTESYDPLTLARAISYLFTKETRSSFALESETPSVTRADRFISALKNAPTFVSSRKGSFIQLQNDIVDPRYAETDWRNHQNFVGETVGGYREKVHFICPRPEDVKDLIEGWMSLTLRLNDATIDPVISAALVAFSFVFIHPFGDGNGRIHRFLIHQVLAQRGFSLSGIIFPVSAAIMRDRHSYDQALETFSNPLFEFIEYCFEGRDMHVLNETAHLYRYFDATRLCEYLYGRVADTLDKDLREELGFVAVYDKALDAIRNVVDMPDRKASLLVRLCMQNKGYLSQTKREKHFPELLSEEIAKIDKAVQAAMSEEDEHDYERAFAEASP